MTKAHHGLMAGKRGLVMGVAHHRSIAWGAARLLGAHGAEIAYSGRVLKADLEPGESALS
jgi:enoyl-[acyl-carrier protein] reductase I